MARSRTSNLTLVLLAGGGSSRMGQDKVLLPFLGQPLVTRIIERLAFLADEILLSTNTPQSYAFTHLPCVPDLEPGHGPLAGLAAGLKQARHACVAAVACDMPFANPELFRYELELLVQAGADAVVPATPAGPEPLHAVYRRETCLPAVEAALQSGRFRLSGWLDTVKVVPPPPEEIARFDPHGLAFWNLNTPEDFRAAEEEARNGEN